jgi:hypothetical protein
MIKLKTFMRIGSEIRLRLFSAGGTSALTDLVHRKTAVSPELQVVVKEKTIEDRQVSNRKNEMPSNY